MFLFHFLNQTVDGVSFECSVCGQLFWTSRELQRHEVDNHAGRHLVLYRFGTHEMNLVDPFKCSLCGKKYATKKRLGSHLSYHRGVSIIIINHEYRLNDMY